MKYLKTYEQVKIDEFDLYFKNLKILKRYIAALEKSYEINEIMLTYAIVLHNFIIIERFFSDLINGVGYQVNKHLNVSENDSLYLINKKLVELYEPKNIVRNHIESFNRLKVINDFLISNPEIYSRVYTEDEIDVILQSEKYNL